MNGPVISTRMFRGEDVGAWRGSIERYSEGSYCFFFSQYPVCNVCGVNETVVPLHLRDVTNLPPSFSIQDPPLRHSHFILLRIGWKSLRRLTLLIRRGLSPTLHWLLTFKNVSTSGKPPLVTDSFYLDCFSSVINAPDGAGSICPCNAFRARLLDRHKRTQRPVFLSDR